MGLSDQRVVVIGGSSGTGMAAARAAAAAGAAVTIASRDKDRLDAALAELPGACDGVVVNTRDEAGVAALFARVGELDHVAVKHAAPYVRPGGSIVLTSGTVAVRPAPGTALAAAGAAAVEGLTRGLAAELAPIRVNAVRPGAVRTPLWDPVPEPQRAALFTALTNRTLTKSIGEADQIAAAHLYLMENHFVTGTVLTVDGGALLAGN